MRRSERDEGLLIVLEFDDHDFDGLVSGVDVGVHGSGRIHREPVGFSDFPDVRFGGAVLLDDVHSAALEGDDDAAVLVAMHVEGRIGEDEGTPDADIVVFELGEALGLERGLLRAHDAEAGCETNQEEQDGGRESFHGVGFS
jgi:hypothetical protein